MEEVYFNSIRIEYARDFIKQAMGRSNKAAHSFYGIKNEAMAIGYPFGDQDFAVIEQALEQLSILYRKHYDFIDSAIHQYANAENKNINILDEILLEYSHLHTNGSTLKPDQFNNAKLRTIDAFTFEDQWTRALLPVNLHGFFSVSDLDIISFTQDIIKHRTADEFITLYKLYYGEETTHTESGRAMPLQSEIGSVRLPEIDLPHIELPIQVAPVELTGLFLAGFLACVTMRSEKEFNSSDIPDTAKIINRVLSSIGAETPQPTSLQGIKGDVITVMQPLADGHISTPSIVFHEYSAEKSVDTQETVFKTIEDFFIYLTHVKYSFDEAGIQVPDITYLRELSLSIPVFSFDIPGGLVNKLVGDYRELENILFYKNSVTIQAVPIGEMQEYSHTMPFKFIKGQFGSISAPLRELDDEKNFDPVAVGEFLPLDNILYALDSKPDINETSEDIITGPYQTISRFIRDNIDDELVLPIVKISQYLDMDEVERNVITPIIFPGIRITDEMSTSALEVTNEEKPLIHRAEQLSEQTLGELTIIDDEGYSTQIPKVNIMGYSSMIDLDAWRFGYRHGNYDSITHFLFSDAEAPEISVAPSGLFTTIQPPDTDNGSNPVIIQQRAAAPYMEVEQLILKKEHIPIKNVIITDYDRVVALNKLEAIKQTIRNGDINKYASKYKNGVDGLAADITQALVRTETNMKDTDTYVQDLSEALSVRIIEEYIDIDNETIPLGSPKISSEEALTTNYLYNSDGDVYLHGYTPQILTNDPDEYKDVTLNVYGNNENLKVYIPSLSVETDIEGVKLYEYKANIDEVTLQTYIPDEIPSSIIQNEGEALGTHITPPIEEDISISITKRLELWLKWLFEMSMKCLNGGQDAEELAATVSRLKQMTIDEPVFSEITRKSIKRFVTGMELFLNS